MKHLLKHGIVVFAPSQIICTSGAETKEDPGDPEEMQGPHVEVGLQPDQQPEGPHHQGGAPHIKEWQGGVAMGQGKLIAIINCHDII